MCGIAGYIHKTNKLTEKILDDMLNTMVLRGPDGDGRYIKDNIVLGMRRLSIIDLENGWQPFFANDKKIIAFQNGEIYNYKVLQKELKQLGYNFVSNSDTEVIAHGYHAWGLDVLLDKIDGMFAIVIYDETKNKIYFARDPFGEKPFYYYYDQEKFLYSSNTFAINKLLGNYLINMDAINEYLLTHFISGEKSIFNGIKKLLPGHVLELDLSKFTQKTRSYFTLKRKKMGNLSKDKLESILTDSIRGRMLADVPVGVFLSGGLDSSIVAMIASKISKNRLKTFSMGFNDDKCDESYYSKYVADKIGSEHFHFYFDSGSFKDLFPKVINVLDEPLGDQAILPTYWLAHESQQHVKVVMSGEGADEIFSGYGYYNQFVENNAKTSWYKKLFCKQNNFVTEYNYINYETNQLGSGFPLVASLHDLNNLFTTEAKLEYEANFYYETNSLTKLQFAQSVDIQTWLANDLLVKLDRMTSGVSLEGRCPYLSRDMVEFAYNLPDNLKSNNGVGKKLLKELAEKYFPEDFIYRKKQGFVLPMEKWLKEWIENKNLEEYFSPLAKVGMNIDYVKSIFNDDGRVRFQFSLLVLNEWLVNYDKVLGGN